MDMNIDQLAAEAARKWCEAHGLNEFKIHSLTAIIQSAIEKATEQGYRAGREYGTVHPLSQQCVKHGCQLSRAAHASETSIICECGHHYLEHRREKDHDECTVGECECNRIRLKPAHSLPAEGRASEQGAVAKLLAALREIVSYDLNCAHETIAQAAIYDFEASQRPTPATNPRCPTCGEPVPDSMLNKILDAVMTPATEGKEGT